MTNRPRARSPRRGARQQHSKSGNGSALWLVAVLAAGVVGWVLHSVTVGESQARPVKSTPPTGTNKPTQEAPDTAHHFANEIDRLKVDAKRQAEEIERLQGEARDRNEQLAKLSQEAQARPHDDEQQRKAEEAYLRGVDALKQEAARRAAHVWTHAECNTLAMEIAADAGKYNRQLLGTRKAADSRLMESVWAASNVAMEAHKYVMAGDQDEARRLAFAALDAWNVFRKSTGLSLVSAESICTEAAKRVEEHREDTQRFLAEHTYEGIEDAYKVMIGCYRAWDLGTRIPGGRRLLEFRDASALRKAVKNAQEGYQWMVGRKSYVGAADSSRVSGMQDTLRYTKEATAYLDQATPKPETRRAKAARRAKHVWTLQQCMKLHDLIQDERIHSPDASRLAGRLKAAEKLAIDAGNSWRDQKKARRLAWGAVDALIKYRKDAGLPALYR